MSASTLTAPSAPTTVIGTTSSLRRTTVVVGLVAAGAVSAAAALLHALGVSFAIDGEAIPVLGFAQLTFVGAVIGGWLVAVLTRRSAAPSRRFLQVTATLTALSCVPSVAMPDDV